MKQVFVSYSRNNLEAVTQLVEDLQAVGIEAWHDQTLTGGQRWWDDILNNIRSCDIFIFALSPESWDSEACRSELGYVVKLGKPILPVLVAEGIMMNMLSAPLNEIQVTDYRRRDKGAAFALLRSINGAPPTPALPDPLPPPPPVPVSYLSTLKDRIESREPLTLQDQLNLIFELEKGQGRSPTEVRDLLLRLKQRDDLLAKIDNKLDESLKVLDEKIAAGKRMENVALEPKRPEPPHPLTGVHPPPARPENCVRCQAPLNAEMRFCASCGNPVAAVETSHVLAPYQEPAPSKVERSESRRFQCPECDASRVISDVRAWLNAQGFDSQQMDTENQSLLLQIKKRGGWRDWVGMGTSLNILFNQSGDTLSVEIGAGKWLDKAAVGAVGMFLLWPLAIPAGYGAWEQMKMPDKIFDYIGSRLSYK